MHGPSRWAAKGPQRESPDVARVASSISATEPSCTASLCPPNSKESTPTPSANRLPSPEESPSLSRSNMSVRCPTGSRVAPGGSPLGALDQLHPVAVGIAHEADPRPLVTSSRAVGRLLRLDAIRGETLERVFQPVHGYRDVV